MLEHFYEPNSGEVLLDGIPIRDYAHDYAHSKIALVGQEPVSGGIAKLFRGAQLAI